MSDFGDIEPDDLLDAADPDPEALARIFVREQRRLTDDPARPATLDDLHPFERALLIFTLGLIIAKLKREWLR
jgi:hypothetical protein